MRPILEINEISKKYKIGERDRYKSLRDVIVSPFRKINAGLKFKSQQNKDSFWALKDVSFNVYAGESIGIIGKNGAGKSTLLKILSRITPPTKGSIISRGRVASLLEVGTGFHPELTGRENIFMNGSILGMRKKEIKKHFDNIVEFSGVERFLETPLKKYSSGMQLRLAFAVAAHLEPEILIIDEVLAVGDAEFQKKCLRKMEEVSIGGRTVLFVSHDLTAIRALTKKCVLLNQGEKVAYDSTDKIINQYLNLQTDRVGDINLAGINSKLYSARLINEIGESISVYDVKSNLRIAFDLYKDDSGFLSFEIFLKDEHQNKLAVASLHHFENQLLPAGPGFYNCEISLSQLNLASGKYYIDIAVSQPKIGWDLYAEDALVFDVLMCNPRNFSWDLRQDYKYGNIAWLLVEEPKFILNDRSDKAL